MITIENRGSEIYLFGRDNLNNVICKKEEFKPYFYVEDKEGTFISIDNKKLKQVICNFPYEVNTKREQFSNHYEADIPYVNRFIIDKIKSFEEENLRKLYLDIETKRPEGGFDDPIKASSEITCIGVYDNYTKNYKQFVLKGFKLEDNNFLTSNKDILFFEDERDMLKSFIMFIKQIDPDIFIAWNGDGFDFPYLLNRIYKLKINVNQLARQTDIFKGRCQFDDKRNIKVEGRILFDLMYGYKKWCSGEGRESWSLDFISNYEGLGSKEKYKGSLDDLYNNDIKKFIEYNLRDVELLVLIDEKLRILEFFDSLRKTCFCKFEDVFMNSKMADCLCLKYAKEHNIVLPSVKKNKRDSFQGAIVQDSIPGLHKNVACVDMKSLYPSIMIGFNISYETILDKYEDNCINGNNKYFFKKERGIIPSIVKPLLDKRGEVNNKLGLIKDRESREYKTLHMEQYTLKTIANSFYGVLGSPVFRLYNREVASSITYLARMTITEVKRWYEEKGFKIIYGDTDSLFLSINDTTILEFEKLTEELNEYFKTYFGNFGVEEKYNIMKIKFEKVFKTIFFKGTNGKGVKKKYAGILIYQDGKEINKFSRMGFESKRSDNSAIGRKFLDNVLKMIVNENSQEEIENYIKEFTDKIKEVPVEDIAIPIGISKPLHKYANQIHARASRLANEKHNAGIQSGDKIKYVYVKTPERVIAFKSSEYMWDGYEVDYEMMIRRIVDLKVAPLFDSLGWKHNFVIKVTSPKKKKVIPLKKLLKQKELW